MSKKRVPLMISENQDITISWFFVWLRYEATPTIHQMRLIIRIIEFCQDELRGIKLRDNLRQIEHQNNDVVIKLPVSYVYFSDFSLADIRNDLDTLRKNSVQFYDKQNKIWRACGFIEKPTVYEYSGMLEFKVDLTFWGVLLNMSSGFRKCELDKLLALPTVPAMWFYIYISEKDAPQDITVEHFKERLGIRPDEYKTKDGKRHRIDNLEARVIKPAQKELNASCPYTFNYEKIHKDSQNPRSPVVRFRFIPIKQPQYRDESLEKKALLAKTSPSFINSKVVDYMITQMGFDQKGVHANKSLLDEVTKYLSDPIATLSRLQGKRRKKDGSFMGLGWVIAALKGEVEIAKKDASLPSNGTPSSPQITSGYIGDLFSTNI